MGRGEGNHTLRAGEPLAGFNKLSESDQREVKHLLEGVNHTSDQMIQAVLWLNILSRSEGSSYAAQAAQEKVRDHALTLIAQSEEKLFQKERMRQLLEGDLLQNADKQLRELLPDAGYLLAAAVISHVACEQRSEDPLLDSVMAKTRSRAREAAQGIISGQIDWQKLTVFQHLSWEHALAASLALAHEREPHPLTPRIRKLMEDPRRQRLVREKAGSPLEEHRVFVVAPELSSPFAQVAFKYSNFLFFRADAVEREDFEIIDCVATHEMVHLTQKTQEQFVLAQIKAYKTHPEWVRELASDEFLEVTTLVMEGATDLITLEVQKERDRLLDGDLPTDKYRFDRAVLEEISTQIKDPNLIKRVSQCEGFNLPEIFGERISLLTRVRDEYLALREQENPPIKESVKSWLLQMREE